MPESKAKAGCPRWVVRTPSDSGVAGLQDSEEEAAPTSAEDLKPDVIQRITEDPHYRIAAQQRVLIRQEIHRVGEIQKRLDKLEKELEKRKKEKKPLIPRNFIGPSMDPENPPNK